MLIPIAQLFKILRSLLTIYFLCTTNHTIPTLSTLVPDIKNSLFRNLENMKILRSFKFVYLRIKKRVACLYGVMMHDGGMLGEYERSL